MLVRVALVLALSYVGASVLLNETEPTSLWFGAACLATAIVLLATMYKRGV